MAKIHLFQNLDRYKFIVEGWDPFSCFFGAIEFWPSQQISNDGGAGQGPYLVVFFLVETQLSVTYLKHLHFFTTRVWH